MAVERNTRLGPYRVLSDLGTGGMGLVYKAEDTRLGRSVALKLLPDAVSRDTATIARFLREAPAAATLNHPNICTIYDVGEDSGRHYIAMELLEGQTLHERLLAGALPLQQAIDLSLTIADALDAAHRAGVVHRDIKPANIVLTSRGEPKILDFGLAKVGEDAVHRASVTTQDAGPPLTAPGTALGTALYMSPEQARGEKVDARTDLFFFGVVLHEMASGTPAFPGSTSALVFDAILIVRPPRWTALNHGSDVSSPKP